MQDNPPIYNQVVDRLGYDPLRWHDEYERLMIEYRARWMFGISQSPRDILRGIYYA